MNKQINGMDRSFYAKGKEGLPPHPDFIRIKIHVVKESYSLCRPLEQKHMRFTRIVALSLTLAVPYALYAQQSKKPRPSSRTTAASPTPPQRPSSASPPRMSPEKAFYYFVAMYGFGKVLRYGGPDDTIKIYGESFDAGNYSRAMADEFERERYKERIRARIAEEVKKVDFNEKFSLVVSATLGEYSFRNHSFPVNSLSEYRFCIGPPSALMYTGCALIAVTAFRAKDAVNGKDFNFLLPVSETDANAFVKSRSDGTGKVDRRIALVITYSVVNDRWQQSGTEPDEYSRPIFSPFIYSVEAYTNTALTAKLGSIPKINAVGADTAEELRLATIAAKNPTKEIGKYRGYPYCRQPKSDGKIHNPLAPPPCDQWVRSYTLTDIGVALVNEKSGTTSETERMNFFDRPGSTLFRENDSQYWNYKTNQAELKYGLKEDKSFSVVWKEGTRYQSLRFESREERDRFFADLSRAFQEWKTKYSPFQFSAGELNIDQRCLAGQTFVPCP